MGGNAPLQQDWYATPSVAPEPTGPLPQNVNPRVVMGGRQPEPPSISQKPAVVVSAPPHADETDIRVASPSAVRAVADASIVATVGDVTESRQHQASVNTAGFSGDAAGAVGKKLNEEQLGKKALKRARRQAEQKERELAKIKAALDVDVMSVESKPQAAPNPKARQSTPRSEPVVHASCVDSAIGTSNSSDGRTYVPLQSASASGPSKPAPMAKNEAARNGLSSSPRSASQMVSSSTADPASSLEAGCTVPGVRSCSSIIRSLEN